MCNHRYLHNSSMYNDEMLSTMCIQNAFLRHHFAKNILETHMVFLKNALNLPQVLQIPIREGTVTTLAASAGCRSGFLEEVADHSGSHAGQGCHGGAARHGPQHGRPAVAARRTESLRSLLHHGPRRSVLGRRTEPEKAFRSDTTLRTSVEYQLNVDFNT